MSLYPQVGRPSLLLISPDGDNSPHALFCGICISLQGLGCMYGVSSVVQNRLRNMVKQRQMVPKQREMKPVGCFHVLTMWI